MSNKRRAPRLDCLVPVDGKEGSAFANTLTTDISKSGIGFIAEKRIPVNSRIPIELDLGEEQDSALVIGKVCWTKAIPGTDQFRIGLTFEDVLPGSKSRLNNFFQNS